MKNKSRVRSQNAPKSVMWTIDGAFKIERTLRTARFGDVGVFDQNGNLVAVYQVGVGTQGGLPIARERQAIIDIFEYGSIKNDPFDGLIIFVPYK